MTPEIELGIRAQGFVHHAEPLKGRLSVSAMDAKGYLVRQRRFSTSAAKGYHVSLDKTRGAHDKASVPDILG